MLKAKQTRGCIFNGHIGTVVGSVRWQTIGIFPLFSALLLLTSLQESCAQGNLVLNGDFETADLTGWILEGNPENAFVSIAFQQSGAYSMLFGGLQEPPDYIRQTLATQPGQTYVLSFWFSSGDTDGGVPNRFTVNWGDQTVLNLVDLVNPSWTNIQATVIATGSSTDLSLGGWNEKDYTLLDRISVAPGGTPSQTPEFVSVFIATQAATLVWTTVPGRRYQVEFTPDLATPNWLPLGAPLDATASTASTSDPLGTNEMRFYRVSLLP